MFLKYLIPFETFTLRSPLTAMDAAAHLMAKTEPRRWFNWFWQEGATPFEGTVSITGFRVLTRREAYTFFGFTRTRNAARPVIVGRFEPAPGGCRVIGHMRLPLFIMVFMPAFLTIWLSIFLTAVMGGAMGDDRFFALFPVAIVVFIYAMWTATFWHMVGQAKASLDAALVRRV